MSANLANNPSSKESKSIEMLNMTLLILKIINDIESNKVDNNVGNIPVISDVLKVKKDISVAKNIIDYYEKVQFIEEFELTTDKLIKDIPTTIKQKLEEIRQDGTT
jgi:hypothetical protein